MNLERAATEPIMDNSVEMNGLDNRVILSFMALDKSGRNSSSCEIRTCLGDVYKIINMLYDYARLMESVIEQWGLQGFHKATYELHAEKCRKIAKKYAEAIGYDYEKALEICRKKANRRRKDDHVGEEALAIMTQRDKKTDKKKD